MNLSSMITSEEINESSGIWSSVIKHCPRAEISEIKRIIGIRLIDENQNVWKELTAVRTIVSEVYSFDTSKCADNSLKDSIFSASAKVAIHQPDSYLNCGSLTSRSIESSDSFSDVIYSILDKLTISKISSVADEIRKAITSESLELQNEIKLLNDSLDSESDILSLTPRFDSAVTIKPSSKSSVPTMSMDKSGCGTPKSCSSCGQLITQRTSNAPIKGSAHSVAKLESKESTFDSKKVCTICQGKSKDKHERKFGKRLPQKPACSSDDDLVADKLRQLDLSDCKIETYTTTTTATKDNSKKIDQSNNSIEESGLLSSPKRSRVRNKFQEARDELYFLDSDDVVALKYR